MLISIINALDVNLSDVFHDIEPIVSTDYIHNQDFSGFSFASDILEIHQNAKRDFVTTDGYQFLYILNGCIKYQLGDQQLKFEKGDSLFFNSRIPHLPENKHKEVGKILVVYILF